MSNLQRTFTNDGTDFSAYRTAERYLRDRGFSVGSMQKGKPAGILFGDYKISKWRNMCQKEQRQCHGTLHTLDPRKGSEIVTLRETAPDQAKVAFELESV